MKITNLQNYKINYDSGLKEQFKFILIGYCHQYLILEILVNYINKFNLKNKKFESSRSVIIFLII